MDSFDSSSQPKRSARAKKDSSSEKPDWLVSLSAVQLVLAMAGVVLLLVISSLSPSGFNELKNRFEAIMRNDMSVSQVVAVIKELLPLQGEEAAATGGEDIEVYEAAQNACFAPIDTTVKITVPVEGEISSPFGYRVHPITGEFGIHNGTDIAAPEGTGIAVALNGTVEEVGFNKVRGNYILVSHGGETQTMYLHCSEIIAPEGTVVRQGEIIACVGSTGWSTGPHLHFSVLIDGKYCNPEWLMNDV